ncbi:hypothetical protein H8708_06165 [Lachnospiraceae bacterium BX10]|jgi:membrane protein|uniref:Metal ABC transporter substrate-binding protein n=1 Tax=Enterocloster hominis (ex Liu et al. 2021) TaxID=2763663 RepID=A0ABR7NRR6_9FIRM|nr:MetQ/NlpA family ABC transporter substrate-binding protein [Enterocloster hominis]MBC8598816.1 hypothetical protein [Enterocloster hominis]MBT9793837.1 hypothetical protein [Clostridium sp. MCC334]
MKKMMSLLLSGMMVLSLAACSGSETAKESTKEEPKTEAKETAAKESEAATTEAKKEPVTLKIGCVAATEPCVQIMKEAMEGTGYEVEVVVFDGNNLPAEALNAGDIDGLFCNSLKWMNTFNEENNADLAMAFPYYFSYAGLYSAKWDSPEAFPDGAKVIVSNGLSNIDGGLRILQNAGLITLAETPSENNFYSIIDIVENPKNIQITPAELTTAMSSINDVDGVVASAVIVKESGVMSPSEHMGLSTRDQMTPQGLIVSGKDENAEWVSVAKEQMEQQKWYDAFNERFDGTFILYSEIDKYFPQ